jgi:hypothetical protein
VYGPTAGELVDVDSGTSEEFDKLTRKYMVSDQLGWEILHHGQRHDEI